MRINWVFFLLVTSPWSVAAPKVVTTTTTLASLVEQLVGDHAQVISITRGPQDPHYVEAKPSFFVKMRSAKAMVSVGLDLEIGWLPNLIRGARNPTIVPGNPGFIEASQFITPIEVVQGKIDRSQGDVHGAGNPHYLLNPNQVESVIQGLAKSLPEAMPSLKGIVKKNADDFLQKLKVKKLDWELEIKKTKIKHLVTYHRTLNDFLRFAGIEFVGAIEAKPGIPPSARQIMSLIQRIKETKTSCILVESFFEIHPAKRIQKSTQVGISVVPVEVQAVAKVKDYFSLMDAIVSGLSNCKKGTLHRE